MNDFHAFLVEKKSIFFFLPTNRTLQNINMETFLEARHFMRGLNVPAHDSYGQGNPWDTDKGSVQKSSVPWCEIFLEYKIQTNISLVIDDEVNVE